MKKTVYRVTQTDGCMGAHKNFNNETEAMEYFNAIKEQAWTAGIEKRVFKKGLFFTKLIESEYIAIYRYDE